MHDKMHKNSISGEASGWLREHLNKSSDNAFCTCTIATRCIDQCKNAATFYECDDSICNVGKVECRNRRFAKLDACEEKGRGVEVVSTDGRGQGLVATRPYEALGLIIEYVGEIITSAHGRENKSHLLQLSRNLYIDALHEGNDSRYVNHSCDPNCEICIWIVDGQPRVGLFARRNGILTGEEITISYNIRIRHLSTPVVCKCQTSNCCGSTGPDTRNPQWVFDNPSRQSQVGPGYTAPLKPLPSSEEPIRRADNGFITSSPPSNGPTVTLDPKKKKCIKPAIRRSRDCSSIVKSKYF